MPDFRLQLGDSAGIVVEVKQFDPNPEEQEAAQGRGSGVLGGKPGHRLRQVIPKANNQLKALGQSDPGMVVVYNRTPCTLHDDPYAVLTAMRGLDVIEYYVPTDQGSPYRSYPRTTRSRQEADSRDEHIGVLHRRAARVLRWPSRFLSVCPGRNHRTRQETPSMLWLCTTTRSPSIHWTQGVWSARVCHTTG